MLNLSYNQIEKFSTNQLLPYQLKYLNCRHNKLEKLPDLSFLKHLHKLNLSHNRIGNIPDTLKYRRELTSLNLSHNRIDTLPLALLREIQSLQSLNLKHNKLTPEEKYWIKIYWKKDPDALKF